MALQRAMRLEGYESSIIRKMSAFEREGTIHLGIGQLKFPAPTSLVESGKNSLDSLLLYSPNQGIPKLRELIAQEQNGFDRRNHSAQDVVVTNGVEEALFSIFGAFIEQGDEVLIPEIAFGVYEKIVSFFGGRPKTFKLENNFGLDYGDLERNISPKTKFIVVNSPSNPTGRVMTLEENKKLANILSKTPDLYVVSDEIYSSLYFGQAPSSISKVFENTIVVNGLSKRSAAAGIRLGWVIAPSKEIASEINNVHTLATSCASIVSQKAAIPILEGKAIDEEKKYRTILKTNAQMCAERFAKLDIPFTPPEGSFYFFPDISQYGIDSLKLAERIASSDTNVITVPGIAFGKAGDKYLRISYAVSEEILAEGLERLSKFFKKLK